MTMTLLVNRGFASGGGEPSDHGSSDAKAQDSPGEYVEFVSRPMSWWALMLGIAPALFALLRASGARVLSYIVPALSILGAIIQYATQKKARVIIAGHGLFYEHGRARRVIYWEEVREVVVDKAARRLEIHVSDDKPLTIHLKAFRDSQRLKEALLSHMTAGVRVIEKPAFGSPFFPAIIVWILAGCTWLVIVASPNAASLGLLALGLLIGSVAGITCVRSFRPTRKMRFRMNLGCLVLLLVAMALSIYLPCRRPGPATFDVVLRALAFVTGVASAFVLAVAVVRVRRAEDPSVERVPPAA